MKKHSKAINRKCLLVLLNVLALCCPNVLTQSGTQSLVISKNTERWRLQNNSNFSILFYIKSMFYLYRITILYNYVIVIHNSIYIHIYIIAYLPTYFKILLLFSTTYKNLRTMQHVCTLIIYVLYKAFCFPP